MVCVCLCLFAYSLVCLCARIVRCLMCLWACTCAQLLRMDGLLGEEEGADGEGGKGRKGKHKGQGERERREVMHLPCHAVLQ